MSRIPIISVNILFEWQERCEQMYLEQAAAFKEREQKGDYSVIYNMNTGAIRCMSEVLLEWAANVRSQIEDLRNELARGAAQGEKYEPRYSI